MLYHSEYEWKSVSLNQNFKWIIDYLQIYVPAGLYPNDLAVFIGFFSDFLDIPLESFHTNMINKTMIEWNKRKNGIIGWFKNNTFGDPPIALGDISDEDKQIWCEMPAYFQNMLFCLRKQEQAFITEQNTLKKNGCNCTAKTNPPRFYHIDHRLVLIRSIGSVLNQIIVVYATWWKNVPTLFKTTSNMPEIIKSIQVLQAQTPLVSSDAVLIEAPPIIG